MNSLLRSWGLSLFVLFEHVGLGAVLYDSSWGLSLFVLFEPVKPILALYGVLED